LGTEGVITWETVELQKWVFKEVFGGKWGGMARTGVREELENSLKDSEGRPMQS